MMGVGVAGVLSLDPEPPPEVDVLDVKAPDSTAVPPPGTNPPATPADVGSGDSFEDHDVGMDVMNASLDDEEPSDVR